jgi:hypothetical protein
MNISQTSILGQCLPRVVRVAGPSIATTFVYFVDSAHVKLDGVPVTGPVGW